MVRLTVDLIAKSSSHIRKKGDRSLPDYLRRLTHLNFSNRSIVDILSQEDLSVCRNLTVLYLYDNQISRISNLGFACRLTHLYLQNNCIGHMEDLCQLECLAKLYLGGNCIAVVEGLERLTKLKELHVENQRLAPGEKLLLDPRTLLCLADSLCVLNISQNAVDDVWDLGVLRGLTHLSATDNLLQRVQDLEEVFSQWPQLQRLDLIGNPVCQKPKYRDRLITACPRLEVLDGKEINDLSRQFLVNWKASKEASKEAGKRARDERALAAQAPHHPFLTHLDTALSRGAVLSCSLANSLPRREPLKGPGPHGLPRPLDPSHSSATRDHSLALALRASSSPGLCHGALGDSNAL
ncbi:protein phosphatase 1 regulatory subunit 42 isoform X1 [Gadus morhua]|uniref:protein phosphatase 1 regulatory subunit 42 isoform X1 n=1 Tax=Gadus morhua TaxID=8049 RepID=UPI0011B4C69F|nr:protein phosphatase 1 regulatory subunit 42 isoform X1 [Gadus morhua]